MTRYVVKEGRRAILLICFIRIGLTRRKTVANLATLQPVDIVSDQLFATIFPDVRPTTDAACFQLVKFEEI